MKFFYWNASFEIGIPLIDAQHRRLVDLINALASVFTESGKLPQVEALITELTDYAAVHFADEERLMDQSTLAESEKRAHRKAHSGFVEKVQQMSLRKDLLQADVSEQVLEFLTTWLISHILGSDRKISRALAEAAAGGGDVEFRLAEYPPVEQVLINALGETERRFRLVTDYAPALIWVCDHRGARGYCNHSLIDFIGLDEREAQDCDWFAFIHPDDHARYAALLADLLEAPRPAEAEYRLRRRDGSYGWLLERILPRRDTGETFMGLIASAIDITAIKRSEVLLSEANQELEREVARRTAQLEHLMLTDPLTGIGNRRFLTTRLAQEIQRSDRTQRPFTAVFFDLDHFKRINDRHGHPVGDQVLVRVAACLRANLRDCDLLGRFGGEEFVTLMVETSLGDAERVAERLRAAVARIRLPGMNDVITISAGLAEWRPGETGDKLLERADRALYRAKEAGRNRCVVDLAA